MARPTMPTDGEQPYGTKLRTAVFEISDKLDLGTEAQRQTLPSPRLRRITQALLAQDYAPAKVVLFGSSTTEGTGSSTTTRRFLEVFARALRNTPSTGVAVPAGWATTVPGRQTAIAGSAVQAFSAPTTYTVGFGGRSIALPSDTGTCTFTFVGTSFKVFYGQYSGGPTISVTVDGGTVTTIATSNATTDRWFQYTSAALTRGSHTVVVQHTGGGSAVAYIRAFQSHDNDEASGVWVYDGGHAGWKASDYIDAVTGEGQWGPAVSKIQPDALVLQLGANDATAGRTTAETKVDLLNIITAFQGRMTVPTSIVIVGNAQTGTTLDPTVWATWIQMWREVADETGGVYFDQSVFLPSPNTVGSLYGSDNTHLVDAGHAVLGKLLAKIIST